MNCRFEGCENTGDPEEGDDFYCCPSCLDYLEQCLIEQWITEHWDNSQN